MMELFQILHNKRFPQKKYIFEYFLSNKHQDISRFLLQLIKGMKKEIKDIRLLQAFFIEFYDMVYHPIIFREVRVEKRVFRILECLALPSYECGKERMKEVFRRINKIKL